MTFQLIHPDLMNQFVPGLAQAAIHSDDTVWRAVAVQVAALFREALTIMGTDIGSMPLV